MFKRDGKKIESANNSILMGKLSETKNKNQVLALEALKIVKDKHYINKNNEKVDITSEIYRAVNGTKFYDEVNIEASDTFKMVPKIEVTNETTVSAAKRLLDEGKDFLVALNFANAFNPGGGWLHGAIAQEEDLARCSALVECLKTKPQFYNNNTLFEEFYHTDGIIYSPEVPFFKDENQELIDKVFTLSIITSPAPNISGMPEVDYDKLEDVLLNRMVKILKVAYDNGHKNIILGAWGCGVFRNDPTMVSRLFKEALDKVSEFEHVCFAVYDKREGTPLFNAFTQNI